MDARSLPPNVQDYVATKAKFCYLLPDTYNFCRDVIDKWAKDEGKTASSLSMRTEKTLNMSRF